ncbi:MAG: hypothetical protein COB02_15925 [Candidatus Cloacimonadota bacterium]|nr:MAG: hypothetical protein COB02_15925 [Candidatus Cloacimonadota bacterium]
MDMFHLDLEDLHNKSICTFCKSSETIAIKENQIAVKGHRYSLFECLECGIWFSPKSDGDCINYESYDENLSIRDESFIANRYLNKLVNIDFSEFETAIEIGCAKGDFLNLIKKSNPHLVLGGVELNHKMCDFALKSGIECYMDYKMHQQKFDVIFANHVIEHFNHPDDFLDLFSSLGSKKHTLVLNFPNKNNIWTKRGYFTDLHVPFHRFYYSLEEVLGFLINEGYTIIEASTTEKNRYKSNLEQSRYNYFRKDLDLFKKVAPDFSKWDDNLDKAEVEKLEKEIDRLNLGSEAFIIAKKT